MIGKYVMTENELTKKRPTPDSVGMGSYSIDSHNIQRYITPEGYVQNEGDIGVSTNGPYQIAYGSLVPKKGQAANLLVPVCLSSSHIAYGSIRMEPVFMILGQSAATAAVMAIDSGIPSGCAVREAARAAARGWAGAGVHASEKAILKSRAGEKRPRYGSFLWIVRRLFAEAVELAISRDGG